MITTRSYYIGSIKISGGKDTAPNSADTGNATKLDNFIEAYERDFLIKTLGYSLNKEFQSNLEVMENASLQTVKTSADQKWKDLFGGAEYELDGRTVKWNGLIFKEGVYDRSAIAFYVYCFFMEDDSTTHTGTGTKSLKGKGSDVASSIPTVIKAWRKFHEMTVGQYNVPTIVQGGFGTGIDWFGASNSIRSLYQFINDKNIITPGTYENWEPYSFMNRNQFGL